MGRLKKLPVHMYRVPSSMVTRCNVKFTDFQLENNNNIISGILYNQFLIDRDSCSDTVGYFMMLLLDEYIRIGREN